MSGEYATTPCTTASRSSAGLIGCTSLLTGRRTRDGRCIALYLRVHSHLRTGNPSFARFSLWINSFALRLFFLHVPTWDKPCSAVTGTCEKMAALAFQCLKRAYLRTSIYRKLYVFIPRGHLCVECREFAGYYLAQICGQQYCPACTSQHFSLRLGPFFHSLQLWLSTLRVLT